MPLYKFNCQKCGGDECGYDAVSVWDVDSQQWVLGSSFDQGWCQDCGEVRLAQRSLSRAEARRARQSLAAMPTALLTQAVRDADRALVTAIAALRTRSADVAQLQTIGSLRKTRLRLRASLKGAKA